MNYKTESIIINPGALAEAERRAFVSGDTLTADLFDRIAELEAENERLQEVIEDTATLKEWEDKHGPAYEYYQFFHECFEQLANHYPCPSVTDEHDKSVIFEAIRKGEADDE